MYLFIFPCDVYENDRYKTACMHKQNKSGLTCFVGIAQVFIGNGGLDDAGYPLPKLIYVSREKKPGYDHHKKAGAMNALVIFFLFLILIACSLLTLYLLGLYISNPLKRE